MTKFPSFSQWKQIFTVLKKKELIALLAFLTLAVVSFGFLVGSFYFDNTAVTPAFGGTYTEGMVGQPRFINPIYGETNDIDRTLLDLVFSGLMSYDSDGKLTTDLTQSYKISGDGKTYDFQLKNDIFWHDGRVLTSDDIVYTIKTIQNSDYKSPLRANWIDVSVEKTSENSIRFTLKNPYNSFLENLTLKILPKHIFEHISPENFALSYYNLQPIGSGPFQFKSIQQTGNGFIKTLSLTSNRKYYQALSFIANLHFQFFEKKDDLVKAVNAKQIDGFTLASFEHDQLEAKKEIKSGWFGANNFTSYSFLMPRYFAIFFNTQKASLLSDAKLRQALTYGVNRNELVGRINTNTSANSTEVESPIMPDFFGYAAPINLYTFDQAKAQSLLDGTGFKQTDSGIRQRATTKKPAFQFAGYLKVGSKNSEVVQLQACLIKLDDSFKTILQNETSGTYTILTEQAVAKFQETYLPNLKPTGETGASTRQKLNQLCLPPSSNTESLTITLTTANQPQLVEIATMIKEYWKTIGVDVQINAVSTTDLKTIIKNRSYDALLYGEALGAEPDLYPFWHSSQKLDPGLNLSSYENKDADQLLKDARQTMDPELKQQKYEKLQTLIVKDAPALFLYNPDYLYWIADQVHGVEGGKIIDPAKRFINATNWFIQTKRVWK